MLTFISLAAFLGIYCYYQTSSRAMLNSDLKIQVWLQNNLNKSKIIGFSLLSTALLFSIKTIGLTSGIIYFSFLSTLTLSLLIVFAPLKIFNLKHIIILSIIIIGIETFI